MDNTIKIILRKKTKINNCRIMLNSFRFYNLYILGLNIEGYATFRLSRPTDPFALPNLILPAHSFIGISALLIAFFGGRIIIKAPKNLHFYCFKFFAIAAFLVWATAGKSFSLQECYRLL